MQKNDSYIIINWKSSSFFLHSYGLEAISHFNLFLQVFRCCWDRIVSLISISFRRKLTSGDIWMADNNLICQSVEISKGSLSLIMLRQYLYSSEFNQIIINERNFYHLQLQNRLSISQDMEIILCVSLNTYNYHHFPHNEFPLVSFNRKWWQFDNYNYPLFQKLKGIMGLFCLKWSHNMHHQKLETWGSSEKIRYMDFIMLFRVHLPKLLKRRKQKIKKSH